MEKREVVILGVGIHKFGRFTDKRPHDLGREAASMALKDAGVDVKDIEAGFCGHVYQPMGVGMEVFREAGLTGIPVTNVEVACLSSSRGVMLAADLIAGGVYDLCLVIGVEKMQGGLIGLQGGEKSYEELMGMMTFPSRYALRTRRHMYLYGTTVEQIAQVSVKAHKNACLNPYAHYQVKLTLEDVLKSRLICDPITLYMSAPNSDGASAVLVCSKEKAKQYTTRPVLFAAWAGGTDTYIQGGDELKQSPAPLLARKVYDAAGVGPGDIDVAQVHDAFSPAEIIYVEKLGFCPEGEGGPFIWEGNTEIGGKIPVNTDGGLEARGHPLGATGGAMIAEIVWQLRGQAGARQVSNAKVGLVHNAGYGGDNVMLLKV